MDIGPYLNDPSASSWFRQALTAANNRDPVDAAADARVLATILEDRCAGVLGRASEIQAGRYDRDLIASMLRDYAAIVSSEGFVPEGHYGAAAVLVQARLLEAADNREAEGIRTVNHVESV